MRMIDEDGVFLCGKYEGMTVEDVANTDQSYLYWVATESNASQEEKDLVEEVLTDY